MEILYNESAYKVRRGVATISGAGHTSTVATGLNTVVSAVGNLTTTPSSDNLAPAIATASMSTTPGSIVIKCYTNIFTATTSTGSVTVNWIAVGS